MPATTPSSSDRLTPPTATSIHGFQPGDRIDLSAIDADAGAAGQQSFVLFTGTSFTAAGQVMVTHETAGDGGPHAGHGASERRRELGLHHRQSGRHHLTTSDFQGVG